MLIRTTDDHDTLKATLQVEEPRPLLGPDLVAIDLDILLIEDRVVRRGTEVLVPHPDLLVRRHAAIPSAEVAPFMRTLTEVPLAEIAEYRLSVLLRASSRPPRCSDR